MRNSIPIIGINTTAHPAANSSIPAKNFSGEPAALKHLLVYEDSQTGLRARQLMSQLECNAGKPSKPVLFRFDLLRFREIWELAAQESHTADVLVISAHASGGVPTEVKSWVTYWLGLKGAQPRKLIAAFDNASPQTSDDLMTLSFFNSLAAWANVELTILHGEGPHAELIPMRAGIFPETGKNLPAFSEFHYRAIHPPKPNRRFWGLNE